VTTCLRCGTGVSFENVSEGYFAVCPKHDEDLYEIEVENTVNEPTPCGAYALIRWNDEEQLTTTVFFSFEPNPDGDDEYIYPLSGKSDEQVFYGCDNGLPELLSMVNPDDYLHDFTVLEVGDIVYPHTLEGICDSCTADATVTRHYKANYEHYDWCTNCDEQETN